MREKNLGGSPNESGSEGEHFLWGRQWAPGRGAVKPQCHVLSWHLWGPRGCKGLIVRSSALSRYVPHPSSSSWPATPLSVLCLPDGFTAQTPAELFREALHVLLWELGATSPSCCCDSGFWQPLLIHSYAISMWPNMVCSVLFTTTPPPTTPDCIINKLMSISTV